MADTFTPHYNLVEPQVGGDPDTWGGLLNGNFAIIDSVMYANSVAQQLPGVNVIDNPCAQVQQRAQVNSVANGQNYSGPDRWKIYNANTGATINQVGTNTFVFNGVTYNTIRQTIIAAATNISGSNGAQGIYQVIEANKAKCLNSGPCVLSFLFNTNVAGQYSAVFRAFDGTTTRYFAHIFTAAANTPMQVSIPIAALGASWIAPGVGPGAYLAIGGIGTGAPQTTTYDSWQTGAGIWSASGNVNWMSTISNFIEATCVKLEPGVIQTPWITPDPTAEALKCQRYFVNPNSGTFETYQLSGQNYGHSYRLSVPLRTGGPTVGTATGGSNGGTATGVPLVTVFSDLQTISWLQAVSGSGTCFYSNYTCTIDSDF